MQSYDSLAPLEIENIENYSVIGLMHVTLANWQNLHPTEII